MSDGGRALGANPSAEAPQPTLSSLDDNSLKQQTHSRNRCPCKACQASKRKAIKYPIAYCAWCDPANANSIVRPSKAQMFPLSQAKPRLRTVPKDEMEGQGVIRFTRTQTIARDNNRGFEAGLSTRSRSRSHQPYGSVQLDAGRHEGRFWREHYTNYTPARDKYGKECSHSIWAACS
jgi:hypothetical protein